MTEESYRYIVITACKNEGKNIPNLIKSVVTQTRRPELWVIVDDGSTDNTQEIIEKAMKAHDWIKSIRLDTQTRDLGLHLAKVIKRGFDYAISYCHEHGTEYDYLGNLDGDLMLPPTFFENLMREFEKHSKLGIASGGTIHIIDNHTVHAKVSIDEPSGGHMLIRRKCFDECGGIPISYAADSVIKAKGRLRGWETRRFENNIATEIRDVGSAEGYWKGSIHRGKSAYFLNVNPIHVLIRGVIYSLKKPPYMGIAYILGYANDFIKRKEQIKDIEVRDYFWKKWKMIYKKRLV